MNLLINLLTSASGDENPTMNPIIWIIPIALLIIFWVLQSRQRKKQQKEVENKMSSLKVGDVVKTIGLIYGEIVEIDRDMETFVLKTGSEENHSFIKVDKMAIYQVIPPVAPVEEPTNSAEEVTESAEETTVDTVETQTEATVEDGENA